MSFQLPFGVRVLNPVPVENKYFNTAGQPYTATTQVFSQLPAGIRHIGLTVNVNNVEYWFETGTTNASLVVKSPSVVSGGGITGATNGLTKTGAKVKLGGALTGNTSIGAGGAYKLTIGDLNGSGPLSGLEINALTGATIYAISGVLNLNSNNGISVSDLGGGIDLLSSGGRIKLESNGNNIESNAIGGQILMTGGSINMKTVGGTFTVSGMTGFFKGIEYANDYSANYTNRSLVDKQYVDNIAAGLDTKQAAHVATVSAVTGTYVPTGGVNASGSFTGVSTTVIDGYTLVNGDRILVKNQVDKKQNGVYVRVSPTVWTRSLDMDGSPAAEVSTGNYVFVTTGATQAASGWVVIGTGDTLTLNVNPIEWAQFSASISAYIGGDGIDINGATINVDLAANSGLDFVTNELRVAPTIGGNGLTLTSGVLNVDVENGLSINSGKVVLGGNLTGDTRIFGDLYTLSLGDQTDRLEAVNIYTDESVILNSGSGDITLEAASGVVRIGGNPDTKIELQTNNITVTLSSVSNQFNYAADYSAGFTERSLVDKEYVDNKVATGVTLTVTGATNGLSLQSGYVVLGGNLTGDTTIGGDINAYGLKLGAAGNALAAFEVNVDGDDIDIDVTNGDINLHGGDQRIILDSSAERIYIMAENTSSSSQIIINKTGTTGIQLSTQETSTDIGISATNGNVIIGNQETNVTVRSTNNTITINSDFGNFEGAKYNADYSANFTERSIVDAAFVTGITSSITVNKLAVSIVNSSTTLTSTDHVVLVDTSGAITITLPSTPNDGQVYHIKDRTGSALANNITINGDGNNIDGAGTASINTDYGSLYIVYSSTVNEWFTLAYVS